MSSCIIWYSCRRGKTGSSSSREPQEERICSKISREDDRDKEGDDASSSDYLTKVRAVKAEEQRKAREDSGIAEEDAEADASDAEEEDAEADASDAEEEDAEADAAENVEEDEEAIHIREEAAEEEMRVAARAVEEANRSDDEEDEEVTAPKGRKRTQTKKSKGRKATQKKKQKLRRLELNLFRTYCYITK